MQDKLLTTTQAGKMLGLDRQIVAKYVRIGKLRGYKFGYKTVLVPESEVERLKKEHELPKL